MPPDRSNAPAPVPPAAPAAPAKPLSDMTRQERIEAFLLDPEKTIFETMEEFRAAVTAFRELFANVDVDQLDQLRGEDGKTPVLGVDYFTEEDIRGLEDFIISKIPKVGVELPSRVQVEEFVRAEVAKIPRIKGDPGEPGAKGEDGKDGSPDTGLDIIKKIRSVGKNQMLTVKDIRGLPNILKDILDSVDSLEELRTLIENHKLVIPTQVGGGSGSGEPGEDGADGKTILNGSGAPDNALGTDGDFYIDTTNWFIYGAKAGGVWPAGVDLIPGGGGDMLAATYDPNAVAGDAFDMDNMVEGADTKILTAAERAKLAFIAITQAVDLDAMETDIAAAKTKTDFITITQAVDLDAVESNAAGAKAKTDFLTVTQAVDLDTMESQLAGVKTKTDHLTVTQAVDLDQIEARVNALDAAVVLKGAWDASAGTFPGGGAAQAGDSYIVSVAGTVNGVDFAVNDRLLAIVDNASTAVFANNWLKLDYTDQVLSVVGLTGAISQASLKAALALVKADVGLSNVDNTSDATKNAAAAALTNKDLKSTTNTFAEVTTIVSSAAPAPTGGSRQNELYITALAEAATIAAPSGAPAQGNTLVIHIIPAGAYALGYNAIFEAIGVTLPTVTVNGKDIVLGCRYNATRAKWQVLAVSQKA